ncbi:hypothetical protein QYE76_067163 [Lolium multiflorum]|uniref:Arabidopsis retrotransposon Orf1 C-terminal domain-containing protein n=1 Tax=Lolium multiflorum TaxID=4521 RepID=A0AAD8SD03_LOLMU|nr:hypothetical protein QYE76_067163 [Lolium multiflorum]
MAKIRKNYDDWHIPESTPTPKKRGMIELNDEVMKEAKKSLKEKGIKSKDVKNLPPIEELCKPIPPTVVEVHALQFNSGDVPYGKTPDQCLDEFDNYCIKQDNFNKRVERHLEENSRAISNLYDIVERTSNDVKMLVKHFQMVQTQIDQLTKVQNDLLVNASKEKHAYGIRTRGSATTQDPLYPEGLPKRVEQDSQRADDTRIKSKKKKKKKENRTHVEYSDPAVDPNSISISDAETKSDNEASDKEEVEEAEVAPEKQPKNVKYTKEDFIANKHGKEREPWVQKPMPFPDKKHKSREEEHFNRFCEWMKPMYLQIPLTDAIKLPPYSKYMKDIVSNKGKIPTEEISTMLANYSFNGKVPKKLGDPGIRGDFLHLVDKAGLTSYMRNEVPQYALLTKIFTKGFKLKSREYGSTVSFKIYDRPIVMLLTEFCSILGLGAFGADKKISNSPAELAGVYREVTGDDTRSSQRGKIRNIQFPIVRYFTYFLVTSVLGRENTSNISNHHLAFLDAAINESPKYNLGALIARRLSAKGPGYGGIIATRALLHYDLHVDPTDTLMVSPRLDLAAMKMHHFVTNDSTFGNLMYRLFFADREERHLPLPRQSLFSVVNRPLFVMLERVEDELRVIGFHEQHDPKPQEYQEAPPVDYTVYYPGASSSSHPEDGATSEYIPAPTTSWDPWY